MMPAAALSTLPNFELEKKLPGLVAGVDEVGRGPWAGPVVAAAVILDAKNSPREDAKNWPVPYGRPHALVLAFPRLKRLTR